MSIGMLMMIVLLLIFVLCFFIYQWWFMNSRFRNMPQVTRDKVKPYNRPGAWAAYSLIVFLILVAIIAYQMLRLTGAIMELSQ